MHNVRRVIILVAVLGAVGVASHNRHQSQSESAANSKALILQAENFLLATINADRATRHAAPLVLNAKLSQCALVHSQHMAQIKQLSHDQFTQDLCIPHLAGGENVGEAPSSGLTDALTTIHKLMIGEGPCPHPSCPGAEFGEHGHYVNLVGTQYHKVGIGIFVGPDGTTWLTEDFTN